MNRYAGYTSIAVAAAAMLGCATTQVKTDRDPNANLGAYDTFAVKPGQILINGVADNRDTLVRNRIETALEQELEQKGMVETAQSPDLIATYTAGARAVTEYHDDWDGWYGPYGDPQTGWTSESTKGTLLIDLVDPTTNQLVWRAIVEMEEDDNLRSAENISEAVKKAFEKYPGT